jgi:PD-(D/E)XK nuclease superfamily
VERISSSRLSTFRECPRKYAHLYVKGRAPIAEPSAFTFGRAWHEALEQWWLNGPEAAIAWLVGKAAEISAEDGAKIAALLRFYNPPRHLYGVLDAEKEYEVPIVNPETGVRNRGYTFFLRLDVEVVTLATGERWIVEHKTTSDEILGFGPYWQRLQIDAQVAFYLIATGCKGVLYDVVRKPMLRISKADEQKAAATGLELSLAYQQRLEEAIAAEPEKYYQFRAIEKTADDLAEAQADLYEQVQMLHNCHRRGMYPRNSNSCRTLYGTCPFLGVCTGQELIDDDTRFRDRVELHPASTEAA